MAFRHQGHHGHRGHSSHHGRHSEHNFSQIPRADIPRSAFNRSHCHKSCFNAGDLVPFYVDEVLPGDTFAARVHLFARLTTPIVPIMDSLYMDTFYFFVPNRLIWENWQKFNGEQDDPGDSTDYLIPQLDMSDGVHFATGTLGDFMGIPVGVSAIGVNALHFRAYNLIYNQWFRDQNLVDSVEVPIDDGPDPVTDYTLLKRAKFHDYFTSCLPWPQKGPAVDLPIGGEAPVIGDGYAMGLSAYGISGGNPPAVQDGILASFGTGEGIGSTGLAFEPYNNQDVGAANPSAFGNIGSTDTYAVGLSENPAHTHIVADLSSATAATINSLREAFQLQRLYERDARGGTRYTEIIRSHFGVISPDMRLQRPEYLGGSSSLINIHPVAKTSAETDSTSPQGFLAAFGVSSDSKGGFRKSFTEHGVIIGLVNVRGNITYQQGLNRMWSRQTRFDFYWPALSHLGEQSVLNQEIYAQGNGTDTEVFGYQERWAEYRYMPSRISGILRSTDTYGTPLDMWHLATNFGSLPVLNDDFIQDNSRTCLDRCLAVESANDTPQIIFDSFIDLKCARPMPVYSVPGLIDHF